MPSLSLSALRRTRHSPIRLGQGGFPFATTCSRYAYHPPNHSLFPDSNAIAEDHECNDPHTSPSITCCNTGAHGSFPNSNAYIPRVYAYDAHHHGEAHSISR